MDRPDDPDEVEDFEYSGDFVVRPSWRDLRDVLTKIRVQQHGSDEASGDAESALGGGVISAPEPFFTTLLQRLLNFIRSYNLYVDPKGKRKTEWDSILLLFVMYGAILIPMDLAFALEHSLLREIFEIFVDLLFFIDIVVSFHTGIEDEWGTVFYDYRKISQGYLKGWFCVDFLATIPFERLVGWLGFSIANVSAISLLKCPRLLRIGRLMKKLDQFAAARAMRIVNLLVAFCVVAHWMGCGFYFLGQPDNDNRDTWVEAFMLGEGELESDIPLDQKYVTAIYWAFTTLSTTGYGDIYPQNTEEMIFATVIFVLGAVVSATIFGNVTALIEQFDKSGHLYAEKISAVTEFFDLHQLPDELLDKTVDYIDAKMSLERGVDTSALLEELPEFLRGEIMLALHGSLVKRVPLFQHCGEPFIRAIVLSLRAQVSLAGDFIVHKGDIASVMYFVSKGYVVVRSDNASMHINLGPGAFFGETACLTRGRRTADVQALSFCYLYELDASDFDQIINQFPEYRQPIEDIAAQRSAVANFKYAAMQAPPQSGHLSSSSAASSAPALASVQEADPLDESSVSAKAAPHSSVSSISSSTTSRSSGSAGSKRERGSGGAAFTGIGEGGAGEGGGGSEVADHNTPVSEEAIERMGLGHYKESTRSYTTLLSSLKHLKRYTLGDSERQTHLQKKTIFGSGGVGNRKGTKVVGGAEGRKKTRSGRQTTRKKLGKGASGRFEKETRRTRHDATLRKRSVWKFYHLNDGPMLLDFISQEKTVSVEEVDLACKTVQVAWGIYLIRKRVRARLALPKEDRQPPFQLWMEEAAKKFQLQVLLRRRRVFVSKIISAEVNLPPDPERRQTSISHLTRKASLVGAFSLAGQNEHNAFSTSGRNSSDRRTSVQRPRASHRVSFAEESNGTSIDADALSVIEVKVSVVEQAQLEFRSDLERALGTLDSILAGFGGDDEEVEEEEVQERGRESVISSVSSRNEMRPEQVRRGSGITKT